MSLEEDIVQREFRSVQHKGIVNILYTHNFLVNELNSILKAYKITRQQFNVLRILKGQYPNPANINLIKDRMIDKMSDASRIVERLRLKGLIERNPSADDRRSVEIKISEKGIGLLKKIDRHNNEMDSLLSNLTAEEAIVLNNLLDKIRTGKKFK
jgi:DNA-binding MarR family transcriptional regulator